MAQTEGSHSAMLSHLQLISQDGLEALLWTCAVIGLGFASMRVCVRWKIARRLREDDIAVIIATLLFLSLCITFQVSIYYMYAFGGSRGPATTIQDQKHITYVWQKCQFATFILFWATLWTVKASFLLLFRRLLIGTITPRMIWWYLVVVFTAVTFVINIALLCGSCKHLNDYFLKGMCISAVGTDMNVFVLWFSSAADVASDFMLMILPWQLLCGLRLTPRQKVALAGIFSLSIVVVVFAILRVTHTNPSTLTFGPITLSLWGLLESFGAVVVACLPSLKCLAPDQCAGAGYSNRGHAATYNPSGRATRSRSQRVGLEPDRKFGSTVSIYSAGHKLDNSDTEERAISPEGIYVTQDFEITESDHMSDTEQSIRYPEEVALRDIRV